MAASELQEYSEPDDVPYVVGTRVGRGAFAVVHKISRKSKDGQVFAAKIFDLSGREERQQDEKKVIRREIEIIRKAGRHKHTIYLIDAYINIAELEYVIVMEPLAEENLESYLFAANSTKRSKSKEETRQLQQAILPWFGCLISGIFYLHEQNIRHRDIKPRNILIKENRIIITDFGISIHHKEDTVQTGTTTIGTISFKAPEWKKLDLEENDGKLKRPGRAADIFSLGAVFFDMLLIHSRKGDSMVYTEKGHMLYMYHAKEWLSTLQEYSAPDDVPWYSTILFLCRKMLQMDPGRRPTAENLRSCWSYQPFEAVPPTGCDCHAPDRNSVDGINGVLERACTRKHILMIDLAIERGAIISDTSALESACEAGNTEIVAILLGYNKDGRVNGAIQKASAGGFEDTVKVLLENGTDAMLPDKTGRTALSWAAEKGHVSIVELLLEKGADVESKDNDGQTPLSFAAAKGHVAIVELLLEKGADVESKDNDDQTPLSFAAAKGNGAIVELLEKAASLTFEDSDSHTLLPNPKFEDLGIPKQILESIYWTIHKKPSKIQVKALPLLLSNPPSNMIAQSPPGTGKTTAFVLAILSRVDFTKKQPQALVLAPSLGLARHIEGAIKELGRYVPGLVVQLAILDSVKKGKRFDGQVVVGTPHTVMDLFKSSSLLEFSQTHILCLDETRSMLNEPSARDKCFEIKLKLQQLNQILLFSSTFSNEHMQYAQRLSPKAKKIKVGHEELNVARIKQMFIDCSSEQEKWNIIPQIYDLITVAQSIIFVKNHEAGSRIEKALTDYGHAVAPFFRSSAESDVIDDFYAAKAKILITTDILPRGLSFEYVSLVILDHIPTHGRDKTDPDYDTYLHHISRLSCLGSGGISISLLSDRENHMALDAISRHYNFYLTKLNWDSKDLDKTEEQFRGVYGPMSFGGQTPTIIVLKEGTDSSQGKGQVISNINACLAIQETIRSTLGPYGGDLLLVDENGRQTITNDGATVMKLLDIVHPAARILTDIARSQDAEVGDGTTSVVVLAGEILKEIKEHVEQGVSSQTIIKGLRRASMMSVNKIKEIAVNTNESNQRDTLSKLAGTAMSSKLIKRNTGFFTKMVVDAVLTLDQDDLNENLIGVKKIPGGSLTDSLFVNGVAFKKTFSYAGFEQQPKSFKDPKIVCLNVELELKSEKDNAEVRVEQVSEYQAIVDAEWQIIYNKMEALYKSGAKVVLSKLPIGDLATQYFADRDIFCAGRVASADLDRIIQACGGSIQSTCSDIHPEHLGVCGRFEEKQIGNERFNFFEDCPEAKTCTLVLRGGAEQFIAEVERSLHDAIMIVKRAIKHNTIVAGGGACEMEISAYLHRYADKSISNKQQAIIKSFAKALEVIPRQLCDNAGFDATDILNKLRVEHRKGNTWAGVDFVNEGIADNMEKFVWEPALVKINAIQAATEASCLILSVDETIKNEESQAPQAPGQQLPPGAAQRALRGRGRGMPRR
ncbi:hypothetical protein V500_09577 [Pseudogymnoascus sp. VKM F-4518 (FW-2643)]|nr:hypothetical protein V500_09577 [Pseudogymnoascus sp. VKM F-4518 (FW-2643)]